MAEGDIARGGFLDMLANLLDRGKQVVLIYGDRDYIGNCEQAFRGSGAVCLGIDFMNRDRRRKRKSCNQLDIIFRLYSSWVRKHQHQCNI